MTRSDRTFTHLIVVGASAGGIESLSALVASLPDTFPAPIVVAQHLHPNRASALGEILGRRGALPVRTISDREPLESGTIYVVPPHRNVQITDHEVGVVDDDTGPQPSIDLLFRSASAVFGENLVAVVLSGTGSDGAAGARDVKYAGGTVVIENPETAAYAGMPMSLAASVVDIVANRERIGELLSELVTGAFPVPPPSEQKHLQAFLEEVRDESGIDFSAYKQPTIQRRLQRRMLATGQASIADYIRHVHQHPEERQRLVSSFLIKVTEFFRDPELFTYFREQVMPELVREAAHRGSDLRIWSAGCATGEEAYSLAITISEVLDAERADIGVRVFATDLDEEAVTFARRGIYPARSLATVDPAIVARYFTPHGEDYEVRKNLRNMLVFGGHDLGQRAPFPRIDLIFCRNVLIYFAPALQRRALQLFAFSLRTGGYLVLGKSETVSPLAEYFVVDQPRLKTFRRVGDRALIPPSRIRDAITMLTTQSARHGSTLVPDRASRADREGIRIRPVRLYADHVLLGLPFGVVVVDRTYDIHYLNGEARRQFGIHTTALDHDLIHQVQHFDPTLVRRAIDQAISTGKVTRIILTGADDPGDEQRALEVTATLIAGIDDGEEVLVAITAIDVSEREQLRQRQVSASDVLDRLTRANEEVLEANQELTRTIAKLRAENEELLVTTEEVQASTEEVETLNEELQASNEELETLNEEMQATVEELNTTNDDLQARTVELQTIALEGEAARQKMQAVLDGIEDPVVVVDADGTVVLRNAAYIRLPGPATRVESLLDAAATPFEPGRDPFTRAANGERFQETIAWDRPEGRAVFQVSGNPVTTDAGEQLGVIHLRSASGDAATA